jgi:ABC-type spermidine/putrescine transport system permease subunit I
LTALLVRPTARYLTGDVSRYLPDAIWSGADDKEQIIYASAASTILLPLIAAALVFFLLKRTWRALRPQSQS